MELMAESCIKQEISVPQSDLNKQEIFMQESIVLQKMDICSSEAYKCVYEPIKPDDQIGVCSPEYVPHVEQVQSEERPFSCKECTFNFKRKYHLVKHVKYVHPKYIERPFSCKECASTFKRKDSLVAHVTYVHSEKRPFSCPECNSTFKRRAYVARHIRTVHSRERPFSCLHCSFYFRSKFALTRHLNNVDHSNNKPFKCVECSYSCDSKPDLTWHVRSVHESDPTSTLKIVNVFSVAPEDSADRCI